MGMYVGMSFRTDSLVITPEILALIAEIEEFKRGLAGACYPGSGAALGAPPGSNNREHWLFYADRRQQANGQGNRESAIQS